MKRIFGIIAAISTLMILLAGGIAYWYSSSDAKSAELAAVESVAGSLATSMAMQTGILQEACDGLAQSSDVIAALASSNPELIDATAAKLQHTIPHTLRLRLLLPTTAEPDESTLPHMGFGDMEMVRATLTERPKPVIQGEDEHRHLAITSPVLSGQQVVGVILLSIKADLPQKIMEKTKFNDGFIELKQDQLTLATVGKSSSKDDDPETVQVPNSRWQILYWPDVGTTGGDIGVMLAIVALPCLLTCLSFFIGYRKLSEFLRKDQSSILKAAKDMMQGKVVGNYPVHLDEMMPVISSIAQFKRVIGQVIGQDVSPIDGIVGKEPDFFDESFDIDFLEESTSVPMPSADDGFKSTETVAISMPNFETVAQPSIEEHTFFQEPEPLEMPVSMPSIGRPEDFVKPKPLPDTTLEMLIPDSWDLEIETKAILTPSAKPNLAPTAPIQPAPASVDNAQNQGSESIFRRYDIRGIAGKNLTTEIVANVGRAFASEALQLGVKTIVVAHDGRLSSAELCEALINGITDTGCDVLDVGLVPTPVLYFVAHHTEGRCGVMITGSSAPGDHNGLKLMLNGELPGDKSIQGLKQRIDMGDYQLGETGSVERNPAFRNEYIGLIAEETNLVRPMTVVIDCSNGSAGELAPLLLKTIGCDVVELNCEVDGKFPNHLPDPSKPESFDSLIKTVKLNNADVGLYLDGDGDRLGIVDSNGRIIWPDRQMMLFARDVLASKPTTEVLYDSACSKHLPEQISKRGGRPVMSNSRPDLIIAELKSYDASLAGTMGGHFFFNDRWFGFNDGLYAAVRMVELLSADMRSSSELFDDLPDSICTPELRTRFAGGDAARFVEQLAAAVNFEANLVTIDGLRVEFADGWGLVRASATDSSLILRFEADTQEALLRIQNQIKQLMLQVKADISLPF